MNEICCQFGERSQLAGIVTEPEQSDAAQARRVGFVLVSAGLVPKFGPFRLYAQLARRLAREGFLAMRFDLGGIGDSQQERTNLPLRERTEAEIRAAIDHMMERYELDGVVLGGLCSGAEDSFRFAERDVRVKGVVMIDPFGYRTPGWGWRNAVHRLTRRTLRALGLYEPISRATAAAPITAGAGKRLVAYRYMERDESSRILRAMVSRKAPVHFVYTGGMLDVFNHEQQLATMFEGLDFQGLVTLDHLPQMEHTQLLEEDRQTLIEAITRRVATAHAGSR
jgi:dienelactone hydrolase